MDNFLKVSGGSKASPKRELTRSSRTRQQQQQQQQQQQRSMMRNLTEAITQVNGSSSGGVDVSEVNENGVVRMKIRVKKQDLKQMLQAINNGNISNARSYRPSACPPLSSFSAEQQLNLLRRKHILRANNAAAGKENRRHFWRPVLQSIPEEL